MNRLVTNDKSQVQVIARAATILRALEDENAGLSLGQIAQRVNLARSTVQRIVAALECEKLVIAATPNGRVRLGPAILRLAASVRSDFIALARPFLERLSQDLHETVDLSPVKKDHLIFIDQVIGSQRLRAVSAVGDTFPLYCTANGKAYLAQLTDKAIEALIGHDVEVGDVRVGDGDGGVRIAFHPAIQGLALEGDELTGDLGVGIGEGGQGA